MTLGLPSISVTELVSRVGARASRGAWVGLIAPAGRLAEAAEALSEEAELLLDRPARRQHHLVSAEEFVRAAQSPADDLLVMTCPPELNASDWRHLDALRSQLDREGPTALLMTGRGAEALVRHAPNLSSWLGGALYLWDEGADEALSEVERQSRLTALRANSPLDDAQVIELAENGTLPEEPLYAEWLMLLGRGDLLHA